MVGLMANTKAHVVPLLKRNTSREILCLTGNCVLSRLCSPVKNQGRLIGQWLLRSRVPSLEISKYI